MAGTPLRLASDPLLLLLCHARATPRKHCSQRVEYPHFPFICRAWMGCAHSSYFNTQSGCLAGPRVPSPLPSVGQGHTYPTVTLLQGLALPCRAAEAAGAGGGAGDVGSAILLQLYEGPRGNRKASPGHTPGPRAGQASQRLSLPTSSPHNPAR